MKSLKRERAGTFRIAGRMMFLGMLIATLTIAAAAQISSSTTDGNTPLGMAAGAPAGSYALSGFESVNPYNGGLNFRLPLLTVGGRGGVGHTIQFVMEQHWRVDKNQLSTPGYMYDPNPNRWSTIDPGFSPGTMVGRRTGLSQSQGILVYCPDNGIALTRFTFTSPDGTEYELRDGQSNGATMDNVYQIDPNNQFSCRLVTTHYRGRVFVTSDGSAATFISDVDINDHGETVEPLSLPFAVLYPSGYFFTRDGTCYRIDGGKVIWIRDRNGNRMTFTYGPSGVTSITDSLNRVVTVAYKIHDSVLNKDYDLISYKGFGGTPRTIKLWYSKLANRLREDFGTSAKTLEFLFPALDGSDTTAYNPKIVGEIELPDGRQYLLRYNYYGELARVELPTGGRIEYEYAAGVTGGDASGVINNSGQKAIYRRVIERRVYRDAGTTLELRESYSQPEDSTGGNQGYVEVKHKDAGGTNMARDRHFYFGSPKSSFFKEPYQYPNWQDGKESRTEIYDKGASGALLRTVDNTWQQPTAGNTWPLSGQGETNASAKPNQPQVTATTTTLNDSNQVSKQTFTYDKYTNKTEVAEYDFGSGTAGALVRKTQTTYVVSNLGVNYATVNPNTTNPDPQATVHVRGLPLQSSVYDAATVEKARTSYEYDNYTQGLTNRSNISGHASTGLPPEPATHTVSYVTRGNVTAQSAWELPSTPRTTRMQYDIAGNAVSVTDPKNNPPTSFDFSDRYGAPDTEARSNMVPPELSSGLQTYALATLVTNALGHTAYTQFDYYVGKPVNGEDANGLVSSGRYGGFADGSYTDKLDRATELVVAESDPTLKRRTRFSYNDVARIITTRSDQTAFGDGVFKSEALYDGLGRTTESRQYETASAYIASLQSYDGLGRVIQTSNPYRPATESLLWTTTVYDGLGRVSTVTTPDNAVVATTYGGSTTTVRDQANKQRRSFTDGLGRLKTVDEMFEFPSATVYATTSYGYDVLDDLTAVTQIQQSPSVTQTRTFVYDSMKRLKQATNPESGTINYTYDANSNLQTKQDARLITSTYAYDALNRVTSRTYSNDPQNTPAVFYKYDAQTLPTGFPATFNRGFSTGRLVATTHGTSTSSAGNYTGYDQLGRVTSSFQQTDSQNYGFSYGYNLAGAMTSETYPSLRQTTTSYDAAGRISTANGQKSGEPNKTYASQFSYASHGAVKSLQLGNGKWEHTNFNSRLQPLQIGLGTSASNSSTLQLDYGYGTTNNNGNVLSQTITIGAGGPTPTTLSQSYGYDALNRLQTASENSGAVWSQTYGYDRFGNRWVSASPGYSLSSLTPQSQGWFNGANNRLFASVYDNAGNQTSDIQSRTFTYDAENRQTTFNATTGQYFYDGDGRRVKKIDASGTIIFVYNAGGQLIAEYHSDPVPPPAGGGGTSYLTTDHLGSTRVVTKQDGTVKARYDYLPFGEELGATIGQRTTGMGYSLADSTKQKFTQKERDNESGLDYFLARYYSSAQGRFTSVDAAMASAHPLNPQSWNRYAYVFNNPLILIDPDGRFANFYNQGGNYLGTDGNNDGKVYVVTDKKDVKSIEQTNQKGGTTQVSSIGTAIELPSFNARQEIGGAAVDRSNSPSTAAGDTQGGFHEEGGIVGKDSNGNELIIPAAAGPVSDPRTDTGAHINVFNAVNQSQLADLAGASIMYHVHPSGELNATPRPPAGTIVIGSGKLRNFVQEPSKQDRDIATSSSQLGISTSIVVGARSAKVYIHDGSGVRATFPLDRFRTVR